ncbi:PAS domain S-box protein [Altericista sp. CCNU0014]|uniref:PAS domain S-box protein n=1 Tax=Altericista sp. CCNU0014 TaxID=3082949 RepID=UPI003850839A
MPDDVNPKWIEAIPHIVWTASETGAVVFLNRQWSEVTGLRDDRGLGLGFLEAVHPEDRDRVKASWLQAVRSRQPYEAKFRLQQASGSYHRVIARARIEQTTGPSFGVDAREIEWVGTFTDIESIVYCKDDLVLKQQFLQALLENLSDGIVACDASGKLTLFNAASQAFHGLPAEPLPAERWADYYDLYEADRLSPLKKEDIPLFRALKGEKVQGAKIRIVPKQGKARVLLSSGAPILHPDGHQLGAVVAMQDITEQERAQAALNASEWRFRAIFNQTFQFMGLLEPDGALVEANQPALDFGGFTAQDVLGKPFWETPWWSLSQEDRVRLRQAIAQAAAGEVARYEVDVLGAHDKRLTIDFSLKPLRDEAGNIVLLIAEGRDITQRKQAEAEVHRLNALLEERVARRTAELEAKNHQNERLLALEQQARAELEAAIAQLEATNCQNEELLEREQTARAEVEQAIAQTASYTERLSLALEAAQMGTWDWDIVTDKTIWDLRHEVIFGYEPGTPNRDYFDWERRVHPEDLEGIHQATHRARDNHESLAIQYRILWPDGSLHWIDVRGRFIYDAAGKPIRAIGVVRDITDRKQAEEALRESQEQFRATFEQAAVGIGHVNLEGRWLRVNQKLCDIVGYSAAELKELTFQDITHPDDLAADLALTRQLANGEIQTYSLEKRYLHKSGAVVWVELTASLVCEVAGEEKISDGQAGKPKYFIAVVEEIGDRKRIQKTLQERARELFQVNGLLAQAAALLDDRNQELDRFVHIVSHDLKAPLRAISNLSHWIEEDLEGELSPENQQQMKLLRSRVRRMEAMIDGLLDYARAGRTDASIESVAVDELLHEIVDSIAPPETFEIDIATGMPALRTKRLLLSQVFANLIGNAIKHHERPDGTIRISSRDKGSFYEFAVADDGPGIAPEHHERIFQIFQAVNPRSSPDSSGIGLSIVKKIVETEEGAIRLESEVGKGTTFYFTWPKEM